MSGKKSKSCHSDLPALNDRLAKKNTSRLIPHTGKKRLFSFITWKSYIILSVIRYLGISLQRNIEKPVKTEK